MRGTLITLSMLLAGGCLDPLEGDGPFADDDFLEEDFDGDDEPFKASRATWDLTLQGVGYDAWEGLLVDVVLYDVGEDGVVDDERATVLDGRFVVFFANDLEDGGTFEVLWTVDADRSGDCGPDDPAWRVQVPDVEEDRALLVDTAGSGQDVCDFF